MISLKRKSGRIICTKGRVLPILRNGFIRFISILLTLFILNTLIVCNLQAQQICHSNDGTISIKNSGFNENIGFKQIYVLANKNDLILNINPNFMTPLFQDLTSGEYLIYGINYEEGRGISGVEVGNHIRNIAGGCLAKSTALPFNICQPGKNCNAPNGYISFSSDNYQQDPDFQQVYILANEDDLMVDIQYNPTFSNLPQGLYKVYAFNYNKKEGITNLNIGQSVNAITGTCIDKKGPLIYEVCEEICDNGIDDDGDGKIDCADIACPENCLCDLKVSLEPNIYYDANTPNDVTDDTFSFRATINGSGLAGWEGGGQNGIYGATVLFGPYPVDSIGASFQIKDKINEVCFTSISANVSSCVYLETCTCCAKNN